VGEALREPGGKRSHFTIAQKGISMGIAFRSLGKRDILGEKLMGKYLAQMLELETLVQGPRERGRRSSPSKPKRDSFKKDRLYFMKAKQVASKEQA